MGVNYEYLATIIFSVARHAVQVGVEDTDTYSFLPHYK